MPAQQSDEFKKAVEESRKLKAKPTDSELLEVKGSLNRAIKYSVLNVDLHSCMACSNKGPKIRHSRSRRYQACSS